MELHLDMYVEEALTDERKTCLLGALKRLSKTHYLDSKGIRSSSGLLIGEEESVQELERRIRILDETPWGQYMKKTWADILLEHGINEGSVGRVEQAEREIFIDIIQAVGTTVSFTREMIGRVGRQAFGSSEIHPHLREQDRTIVPMNILLQTFQQRIHEIFTRHGLHQNAYSIFVELDDREREIKTQIHKDRREVIFLAAERFGIDFRSLQEEKG